MTFRRTFSHKGIAMKMSAVTKRIATAMAGDGNKTLELEKQACLLHSLDLLKSGGMFK